MLSFVGTLSRRAKDPVGVPLMTLQNRQLSVTGSLLGKRNMRKFFLGNKRGSRLFRRDQALGKYDDFAPIYTEVRDTGFKYDGVHHDVPEMIPDFIVPDLTDCPYQPYVSYRTADIYQTEFTAQDLFDVIYRPKIVRDFNENKLDADGFPLEPSAVEKLTPEEAWIQARKCGNDLFSERTPKFWECLEKSLIDEPTPQIQFTPDDLEHPTERKRRLEAQKGDSQSLLSPPKEEDANTVTQ